jgi:hypothetical protein
MAIPVTQIADTLLQKASELRLAAGTLRVHGRMADANDADQEAFDCENKAHALKAGTAAFTHFPTAAELNQLQMDCADLQVAIDMSTAANNTAASLNNVATAASKASKSVPASSIT